MVISLVFALYLINTKSFLLIENILKHTLKEYNRPQCKKEWQSTATEWFELAPDQIYKEAIYWEDRNQRNRP